MRQESSGWGARLVAVTAVALVAVVLGTCGGDDEEKEPQGTDLTAMSCPVKATGKVAGVQQFEPAPNAFDTGELIGEEVHDAAATADEHGCHVIVSLKDGKGVPVPVKPDPTAVYVYTEDDVVTQIEGVGGGL